MSVRYKRNFIVASVLHVAIIASVLVWENFLGGWGRPAMASVSLYTPADILGDMPKGDGYGRGSYKPPEPAGAGGAVAAPSENILTPSETIAPKPAANEVAIPRKPTAPKKPVSPAKPAAQTKPAPTTKPATTGRAQKGAPTTTTKASGASAEDIKNRFAKALQAAEDGTPYGDGKKAGGGSGKGRIGSPTGAEDGVVGGVGQGSANWRYFQHVHDVMYEAWEQPTTAVDKNVMTTVRLRVARDGSIVETTVQIASGNKLMDESVMAALRKVPRLDPPPDSLVNGQYAVISVNFQVEG
jgi:colicin import membrane protein